MRQTSSVLLSILPLLLAGCFSSTAVKVRNQANTFETCPIDTDAIGIVRVDEYANFFPESCPGVVMQVLRFDRSSDASLYREILENDPDSNGQIATVKISARREYRNGFRYIIIQDIEANP